MFDAVSAAAYAAATIAIGESVRKLMVNRFLAHELSRDYLAAGLTFLGISLIAGAPSTMRWSDAHAGLLNIAFLVHCLMAMAAMVCVAGFLRTVDAAVFRVRTAVGLFVCCVSALNLLYLLFGRSDPAFGASGNHHPASVAFTLIYLTYMVTWVLLFIRGAWQISRGKEVVVQLGIFLAALGMTVGLVGLLWKTVTLIESLVRPPGQWQITGFALTAEAVSAALFSAGSAFAAAVRKVHDRRDRLRAEAVRSLWTHLQPVWSRSGFLGSEDAPAFRRQIVQVFDAWLILRSYVDLALRQTIANEIARRGLRARRAARVTAAAELRIALEAFERGAEVPPVGRGVDPAPQRSSMTTDEDRELDWITDVAAAWNDPVVAEIVDRARGCVAEPDGCSRRRPARKRLRIVQVRFSSGD